MKPYLVESVCVCVWEGGGCTSHVCVLGDGGVVERDRGGCVDVCVCVHVWGWGGWAGAV